MIVEDWQSRRVSSIVAINSLIQRHRRADERWKETYEEMRKMLTLVVSDGGGYGRSIDK